MTTKKTHAGDEDQPKRPKQSKPKASQPKEAAEKAAPKASKPKSAAKPTAKKAEPKPAAKATPKASAAKSEAKPAPKASAAKPAKARAAKPKAEATAHDEAPAAASATPRARRTKSETASESTPRKRSSAHHDKEEHVTERPTKDHAHKPASPAASNSHARPSRNARPQGLTPSKMLIVAALVLTAFVGSYNFATAKTLAKSGQTGAGGGNLLGGAATAAAGGGCGMSGGSGGGGGGGCCGGGGAPVEGKAAVEGNIQKISVDTSAGSFNPNVIKAKAGVPIEIAFSQSPGGCLSGVLFPDFGINQDLTSGPQTVKLPALEKGEYTFYCQMQMVSAKIVVE